MPSGSILSGFNAGDSVVVSYSIINNGTVDGTAWVKFMVLDESDGLRAVDSVQFSLLAGANTIISKKMLFDVEKRNCNSTDSKLFAG